MSNVVEHPQFRLLTDPKNTFTIFPILNDEIYDFYKKHLSVFWTVEEVDLVGDSHSNVKFETLGFINEEGNEVGRVHMGVLVLAKTNASEIRPKANEVAQGGWHSLEELDELCKSSNVEEWGHHTLEALKKYLGD